MPDGEPPRVHGRGPATDAPRGWRRGGGRGRVGGGGWGEAAGEAEEAEGGAGADDEGEEEEEEEEEGPTQSAALIVRSRADAEEEGGESETWLEGRHKWVGRRVRRFYDGVIADGVIDRWLPRRGADLALWHMAHDDGDEEGLDADDARRALAAYALDWQQEEGHEDDVPYEASEDELCDDCEGAADEADDCSMYDCSMCSGPGEADETSDRRSEGDEAATPSRRGGTAVTTPRKTLRGATQDTQDTPARAPKGAAGRGAAAGSVRASGASASAASPSPSQALARPSLARPGARHLWAAWAGVTCARHWCSGVHGARVECVRACDGALRAVPDVGAPRMHRVGRAHHDHRADLPLQPLRAQHPQRAQCARPVAAKGRGQGYPSGRGAGAPMPSALDDDKLARVSLGIFQSGKGLHKLGGRKGGDREPGFELPDSLEDALRAHEVLPTPYFQPPPYATLRRSVYNHSRPREKLDEDDVMVCSCSAVSGGCDERCHNRAMQHECNPSTCPMGQLCSNRPFSTLGPANTLPLQLFKTFDKGWGVMATRDLDADEPSSSTWARSSTVRAGRRASATCGASTTCTSWRSTATRSSTRRARATSRDS